MHIAIILSFALLFYADLSAQNDPSVARRWNEVYLLAIRSDLARPVVHARNLYHGSAAMYDAWSLVNRSGTQALVSIDTLSLPNYLDRAAAAEKAVSYAAYRLLLHRYRGAPGTGTITAAASTLMNNLGYSIFKFDVDYTDGDPASLGNYIASRIIAYGMNDGANEALDYANNDYPDPVNPPLELDRPFSILSLRHPDRWQQLQFPGSVVDQSGNPIGNVPKFLGASWGRVTPFAIPESAKSTPSERTSIYGNSPVYHDPGPPPPWDPQDTVSLNFYRWNFETVLKWSSHLDATDGVRWNISPGARGNVPDQLPLTRADYYAWYDQHEGGQPGKGRALNPVTGEPYADNFVPRGDYVRVLAEFWADGIQSETPPGHWFDIFNTVMDHRLFERKLWGKGKALDPLQYDVKAYLTLGGAMHDAAVSAWSIKGKYDYVRPITAIRYLATRGQATAKNAPGYDSLGLRLDPGYIEVVNSPSEVVNSTALMRVKARAWVGNSFIDDPATEAAGVDWINPTVWEPYQRPNFVTPNFAGYVSGHSTFSAAAATVLTELTGTPYFPGGLGEFVAKKNEFLVFEEGPTVDVVLQWATYQDASAETSLSRIWGGIHPPIDDIPGRRIGRLVGADAVALAEDLFDALSTPVRNVAQPHVNLTIFPNPAPSGSQITVSYASTAKTEDIVVLDLMGRPRVESKIRGEQTVISTAGLPPGIYLLGSRTASAFVRLVITR